MGTQAQYQNTYDFVLVFSLDAVGTQAQYQNTYDFVLVFSLCVCVGAQAQYCCFSLKIFVYVASSSRFRRELRAVFHLGRLK